MSRLILAFGFVLVGASAASGSSFPGPPDGQTGAPLPGDAVESTCASFFCHSSHPLDTGPGLLSLELPPHYAPGAVYAVTIRIAQQGQSRWGFEVTALDASLSRVGAFEELDSLVQVSQTDDREYAKHTREGTAAGTLDSFEWHFEWQAPADDVGPVSFHATANAANDSTTASGDYIYSRTEIVPEPGGPWPAVCACASMLGLTQRTRSTRSVREYGLSPPTRDRARGPC